MQRFRLLQVLHSVVFRETPPPLRGRSIRAADREGDDFSDSATSFPNPRGGREKTCLAHRKFAIFLFAPLIVSATAQAEVLKFMNHCAAQQQLCPSYQLVLTPPDGWVLDAKASAENKVQIMVPKGQSFATAEPLIYVQVFYQPDKQQTLTDFARTSNARWIAANPTAKISDLPAVERANGKPAFLRFAFENPRKAQQAYEVGALGVDSDKDGNDFGS